MSAFGSETSQQGLFVFWISDYNNACQIAFCFMPMHAATSEGKVPLYWEPSDKSWRPKEYYEWFSILSNSGHLSPEIICNNFIITSDIRVIKKKKQHIWIYNFRFNFTYNIVQTSCGSGLTLPNIFANKTNIYLFSPYNICNLSTHFLIWCNYNP